MAVLVRIGAFRNAYLLRGLVVWGVMRFAMNRGGATDPGLPVEAALLTAVAAAVLLDARRRREHVFLGNLGVTSDAIALCSLPPALVAECLLP